MLNSFCLSEDVAFPARGEIKTLCEFPTSSGFICSYVSGLFITALMHSALMCEGAVSDKRLALEMPPRFDISVYEP